MLKASYVHTQKTDNRLMLKDSYTPKTGNTHTQKIGRTNSYTAATTQQRYVVHKQLSDCRKSTKPKHTHRKLTGLKATLRQQQHNSLEIRKYISNSVVDKIHISGFTHAL